MNKLQLLAAILTAGAALALDIPAVPTWPSGRCTDKSLTIPSWIISKYQVAGGTVSFRVDNRAADPTGLITDISCTPQGDCQPTGNSEITAAISKDENGHTVVTLRETWVCGDGGEQVVFDASGNTTISQCSGSDCVSPIPYLVYGGLTLPVPLKPTQPSPPPGYDASTCANVGADQWAISGLTFQNYTTGQCKAWYIPDVACLDGAIGVTSPVISKGIYLNLTVTNKAINYPVTCGFVPSYDNYMLPNPLRCTGGDFNEITLDITWSGSAPNFNLKIEQLWYCLEHPDTNVNPTAILASGSVDLALKCQSRPGITGNADDIITTCADPAGSRLVGATENTAETLPAFSLVTAYPAQGGCTFVSVVDPTFYMRDVSFQTGSFTDATKSQTTLTRFSCTLTGPGFADYSFYGGTPISGSGVNAIYDCNAYNNGQPKQDHWNCTFSFNPFSAVITLDKVWQCNDKNPTDIIYFDGSGSFDWKIDPHYYCEGNDTLSCLWTDDLALLQPGIPYKIPKVTASLVNVLPPDRENTVRVSGKWSKVNGN